VWLLADAWSLGGAGGHELQPECRYCIDRRDAIGEKYSKNQPRHTCHSAQHPRPFAVAETGGNADSHSSIVNKRISIPARRSRYTISKGSFLDRDGPDLLAVNGYKHVTKHVDDIGTQGYTSWVKKGGFPLFLRRIKGSS